MENKAGNSLKVDEKSLIYGLVEELEKSLEGLYLTSDNFIEGVAIVLQSGEEKEKIAVLNSESGHSELYYKLESLVERVEVINNKLFTARNMLEI